MKKLIVIIVLIAAVVGLGVYFANQSSKPQVLNNFAAVPNDAQLTANLAAAGLDKLSAEGTVEHIHQHIDIIINGNSITIPADIGIGKNFISPLHIHDTTNILHVESPVQKDFTLGQFFDEWGVVFNNNCISTYCADDSHKLEMFVNGQPVADLHGYVLKAHDEIYIWYGPKDQNPDPIKSYNFPEGY